MKSTKSTDSQFTLPDVVNGAVSPFGPYCMGYMNPGASGNGYISTMKISTGSVSVAGLDPGTEGIVSYDRSEKNDAYIGQINMITASSFCGINGALWGYHLAKADEIARGALKPMYYEKQNGRDIPVYSVYPLLDAAKRLFGIDEQRRFPPMPGAHVSCANKSITKRGPCWVWSAIAVAIVDNRDTDANLFIEDVGTFPKDYSQQEVIDQLEKRDKNVTKSVILCGQDQKVQYKEIYVGYKYQYIPEDFVGCALTCGPYVLLARNAIPAGHQASDILEMTISQWEQELGLPPLKVFDDTPTAKAIGSPSITKMKVRSGDVLNAIQVTNGSYEMPQHGGNSGSESEFQFGKDDHIRKVYGYTGTWFGWNCVIQLMIETWGGKTYGPFGTMANVTSKAAFSYEAKEGEEVLAFHGTIINVPLADGTRTDIIAGLGVTFGKTK